MENPLRPPVDAGFRLIETFRWEPGKGVLRRARHLARLARSAARLGVEPKGVDALLNGLEADGPLRVRLTVDRDGQAEVTSAPYQALAEDAVWRVAIARDVLLSGDPWLGVKTTERALYDQARASLPEGVDEYLFANEQGNLCEGTITNLFVPEADTLLTPPLASGVLPGILREEMLETGQAREEVIPAAWLTPGQRFYMGNSLRGLIPAVLVGTSTP